MTTQYQDIEPVLTDLELQRREFESACVAKYSDPTLERQRNGQYKVDWVEEQWQGWQLAVIADRAKAMRGLPTDDEIEQAIYAKTRRFVPADTYDAIRELIAAHARRIASTTDAQPAVRDGWVLVPVEPDADMLFTGIGEWNQSDDPEDEILRIWRAMLEVSPQPSTSAPEGKV